MKTRFIPIFLLIALPLFVVGQQCFSCKDAPPGTIHCDDFESGEPLGDRYFEYGAGNGQFIPIKGVGRDSSIGMRVQWKPGQVGVGGFKKSFGKTPSSYIGKHSVNPNEQYDEIYWRLDLRTQEGWQGGGADKLSRAMTLANSNWAQGMIAHLWSGGSEGAFLGMDPASGINHSGQLVSTQYNDFNNLRWLGWKAGDIDLFSTANSNKWYCIEAHVKLNTPGQKDGIFEFWINDTLQAGSYDLNWHGDWNSDPDHMKINAIFIENFWNNGSPVEQERYMDNFVISTEGIGCHCKKTTSTKDQSEEFEVEIFPNPSIGMIHLRSNRLLAMSGYKIEVLNTVGQMIYQSEIIKNIRSSIDISSFDSGIYFYRVLNDFQEVKNGSIQVVGK